MTSAPDGRKRFTVRSIVLVGLLIARDIFSRQQHLRQRLMRDDQTSLLTAQRVILNCRVDERPAVLREWVEHLVPGGVMLVDCPHPTRALGAVLVGPLATNPQATTTRLLGACQTADDHTFEECREYARDLASRTGLNIINNMPAQLPPGIASTQVEFSNWLALTRARTITGPLSIPELHWFHDRYAEQLTTYYRTFGLKAGVDIAAVIVAFQRPSTVPPAAPSVPATIATPVEGSTKWGVEEELHGDAGERAKKAARRKSKAKKGDDRKKGDDDMGGAGGVGSKV